MSRSFVISLVVVAVLVAIGGAAGFWVREMDRDPSLGTKSGATATDTVPLKPQPVGDTIYVSVREIGEQPSRAVPFALRELVRQGLLLTARDELGLATRDVLLREEFPKKPDAKSAPFELTIVPSGDSRHTEIDCSIIRGPQDERIWREAIFVDLNEPQSIATAAEKAEAWSRTEFKDVLTQIGAKGSVPAARASSEVPAEAVDLLWSWNDISILGGLRRIHSEIHEKGESPQLLAALVVGYANLGSLTEFYYSAAHKAYHARALLYAERLMHENDGSPWALWHRAYARTLFGADSLAAEDVAAAKKKASAGGAPLPFWTGIVDAFSQGQLASMLKQAKTPQERGLARYLDLEAVMFSPLNDVRLKAARAFLEVCPDSPRGYDLSASFDEAGPAREQANAALANTGKFLHKRLLDIPGLSPAIAQRLKSSEFKEGAADLEFRKQAIAELKQAAAADHTEPSLSAVAQAVEEINFAQLMRKLTIEHNGLGLSVESTIDTFGPVIADHPDSGYLTSFTGDKSKSKAGAAAARRKFRAYELTDKDVPIVKWLSQIMKQPRLATYSERAAAHVDLTVGDQMRYIQSGLYGSARRGVIPDDNWQRLWSTSGTLPVVVAMRISHDWNHVEKQADKYQQTYADDPLVMNALAQRYYDLKRYGDAERCAKRVVDLAPGYAAYRLLASTYKARQDDAHWKATMDQAIKLVGNGAEQATLQNDVALALLEQNRAKEAVTYADAAAKSASTDSLMTATRCHELLDEWDQAEHFVRAASEHDDHARLNWMCWCHRTGHGDAHAADAFAHDRLTAWGAKLAPWQSRDFGLYFLILGDNAKALPYLQQSDEASRDFNSGLHAAIAADALGKSAERDALLKKIGDAPVKSGGEIGEVYRQLAAQLQHALPPAKAKTLDLGEVDRILASSHGTDQSAPPYFVAIFLKNRGDLETAKKYLIRCARTNDWQAVEQALACQLLRQMKVKVPPADAAPKTPAPVKAAAAPRPHAA